MSKTIKRRVEINIETHEITVVRRNGARRRAEFCRRCGAQVSAFGLEQYAVFVRATVEEIRRRAARGELHLIDDGHESPLVCGNSFDDER